MLRTISLTVVNEARLLLRDPVVLLMLVLAPVVIITVAGYSLGGLYGRQGRIVTVPVVDHDHGAVGEEVVRALRTVSGIEVAALDDVEEAKRRLRPPGAAPLAIEVPSGTTDAIRSGRDAVLVVHVDAARRLEVNALELEIAKLCRSAGVKIRESALAALADSPRALVLSGLGASGAPALPGGLDFEERPAIEGAPTTVNAFDQYVPGFGVTFLLIGMMLGIALTLYDERDWGTLERLRASGSPLVGIFAGKVLARFLVGVAQMGILFLVGWMLFDISLGRNPLALLLPTIAMSFAAASLGLIVPAIASAHDSVMPLGTMTSMAFAAIGGCWWPLDFEPEWLRQVAKWLPTTWTMEAYNDLMIRRLPWSVAVAPTLATVALGTLFLAVGIHGNLRRRS